MDQSKIKELRESFISFKINPYSPYIEKIENIYEFILLFYLAYLKDKPESVAFNNQDIFIRDVLKRLFSIILLLKSSAVEEASIILRTLFELIVKFCWIFEEETLLEERLLLFTNTDSLERLKIRKKYLILGLVSYDEQIEYYSYNFKSYLKLILRNKSPTNKLDIPKIKSTEDLCKILDTNKGGNSFYALYLMLYSVVSTFIHGHGTSAKPSSLPFANNIELIPDMLKALSVTLKVFLEIYTKLNSINNIEVLYKLIKEFLDFIESEKNINKLYL